MDKSQKGRKNNQEQNQEETEIAKIIQKLISNGHSWSSIKKYTLAEIGVFLRAVIEMDEENKMNDLTQIWMGNNLSQQGLNEVTHGIQRRRQKSPEVEAKNSRSEFLRLAQAMSGRK